MPFNGNGVFVRLYNWTVDASNSLTNYIRADKMDAEMNGFATGLSNCVTRDGEAPPLANLPMGGYKFTGLGQGSVAGDSVTWDQVFTLPTFSLATLANPTITGTATVTGAINATGSTGVTVPTAAPGDSSNKAASTAFVMSAAFQFVVPAWYQQLAFQQAGII